MAWNTCLPAAEWYDVGDEKLDGLIREVQDTKRVAIDTETTGLNIVCDLPLFWSLSWGERRICMPASTLFCFEHIFKDPNRTWLGANIKYDNHILANVGMDLAGDLVDVQVMHALLYEEKPHGLKYMVKTVLEWEWAGFEDTFRFNKAGKLTMKSGMEQVLAGGAFKAPEDALLWCHKNDLPSLVEYASNDAYGTLKCADALEEELAGRNIHSLHQDMYPNLREYFHKIEKPFTRVLWSCERHGVKVSPEYLQRLEDPIQKECDQIARDITRLAGMPLNPRSAPALSKYFFEHEKLKPRKLTKGGTSGIKKPAVDSEVLEQLAIEHPVAKLILDFRELDKLLGTYVHGLRDHLDYQNRIHSSFRQAGARTGRLSSADPNLQNIPNPERDKFGIRRAFMPEDGYTMIVADYDTLEMRLLAAASLEPSMIQLINEGQDIHMGNATMVFGPMDGFTYEEISQAKKTDKKVKNAELPESALTERMHHLLQRRLQAKTIGFGLVYGMREFTLAARLGIPVPEAKKLMGAFMDTYPGVQSYLEEVVRETEQYSYSFTVLGRPRFFPGILSDVHSERAQSERQALNHSIQGSAADIVKLAMNRCFYEGDLERRFGCKMLLQVHDELMFECPPESVEEVKPLIREYMENSLPSRLAVPFTVSMGVGKSWAETH